MANVNMTKETLKETSDIQKMLADLTKVTYNDILL